MQEIHRQSRVKLFGGWLETYQHDSSACASPMRFSIYLPPASEQGSRPVLYWLSGLTCTEENFMIKAGAQRLAAQLGIILVAPDTSPRGLGLPGEDDHWDFGSGAGFYLNATREPWSANYHMYRYVAEELPALIDHHFPSDPKRMAISGHSMGGHGALVIGQRNPDRYRSVSAFAPICAPMQCPWGVKAFSNYLGDHKPDWRAYDACEILKQTNRALPMLVDQGSADSFLEEQLKPDLLTAICEKQGHGLDFRMQAGYDHGYYFIASFIEDHLHFHSRHLGL